MNTIESHQRWQAARHAELAAPDSWLGLIGLFWLEPGLNAVGSADGSTVQLPAGMPHLGDLRWQDDKLFWMPVDDAEIELQTDLNGQATTVDYKNWSFLSLTATVGWPSVYATGNGRRRNRSMVWPTLLTIRHGA